MKQSVVTRKGNMATMRSRNNILYLNYYANGKRVQRSTGLQDTASNRKKLEREIIPELTMRIKLGDFSKPKSKKFSHYFHKYMGIKQEDKGYAHKAYVYKKVDGHFGEFEVDKINRLHIKEYLNSLNIKNSSRKLYLTTIRGVLDIALDDEAVDRNIAKDIIVKKDEKEESHPFSDSEVMTLLVNSKGMLHNYLGIAFYTGLRSGEILGLMHSDIKEDRVSIKRSISKGKITTPKTRGSIRDIPLFEKARPFIENQMQQSKSLYLFENDGHCINDVSYFKRQWHKLIYETGIEYRKLYNTRHTFITAMLNSSLYRIMDIARIVGHTSPRMIMTTYSGFIGEEHLEIDTKSFGYGDSLVTVEKSKISKKA